MSHNNYGSQNGDGNASISVMHISDDVYIVNNEKPTFTSEQLDIMRNSAFGGRNIKTERLNTFTIITGLASIIGLYFALPQPFSQRNHSFGITLFFFFFLLIISIVSYLISLTLKKRKFMHLAFRKYYLESCSKNRIYLNKFTAICPWCDSKMNLRNIGSNDEPRDDLFICERNPKQHTILLDPTMLPEIN